MKAGDLIKLIIACISNQIKSSKSFNSASQTELSDCDNVLVVEASELYSITLQLSRVVYRKRSEIDRTLRLLTAR